MTRKTITFIRRLATVSTDPIHINPHRFKQYIQLTDGSVTCISSLSPQRPFIKLNIDSLTHPSWNIKLRDKMLLDDQGEVARFRKRFGGGEMDYAAAADVFKGETRQLDSQVKSGTKPKTKGKRK